MDQKACFDRQYQTKFQKTKYLYLTKFQKTKYLYQTKFQKTKYLYLTKSKINQSVDVLIYACSQQGDIRPKKRKKSICPKGSPNVHVVSNHYVRVK